MKKGTRTLPCGSLHCRAFYNLKNQYLGSITPAAVSAATCVLSS
jgi:hypothetical protein